VVLTNIIISNNMNCINEISEQNNERNINDIKLDQQKINPSSNENETKKRVSYICSNELIKYMSLLPSNKTRVNI